jgi:DNA-binding MarR family transcriptional regulator
MKSSEAERFEKAYRLIWGALNKPDDPDLSQHERQVLHHVAAADGTPLTWLAQHLGLPKSTTSVLVKALAQRGFVHRVRDPDDERRLSITLTDQGRRRIADDTVLDPAALSAALAKLPAATRAALLDGLELLAEAAKHEESRHHHG